MLKLYVLWIGFMMQQVLGCTVCKYEKNNPSKICYVKAQACLTLECGELTDIATWIRQYNQTNVTLLENAMNYFPNLYNTTSFRTLNILSVQAIDSGIDNFFAIRDENFCKFSVLAYDLENWNGSLTVGEQTKLVNSTEGFDVELKTFNQDIQLSFKYEALPLEFLTFNDSKIESSDCQSTIPWLNCLEANFDLKVDRCVNSLNYTFGYGYETNYSAVQNLMAKNYTHIFSFFYQPQTKIKQKTIVYQETDTSVNLLCELDCANPAQNLVYEFVKLDNLEKILLKNDSSNSFDYKILSNESVVEIVCTIYNSIVADPINRNESQTRFLLYSKSSTEVLTTETFYTTLFEDNSTDSTYVTSTGNTTDYVTTSISNSTGHPTCPPVAEGLDTWLIVVIAVACALILVVVLLVVILVYMMNKKSGSYKKSEKLSDLPLELDKSSKQKQLNENLESNPVYAMTNSTKNLNQTSPTARSDPNQTIL